MMAIGVVCNCDGIHERQYPYKGLLQNNFYFTAMALPEHFLSHSIMWHRPVGLLEPNEFLKPWEDLLKYGMAG